MSDICPACDGTGEQDPVSEWHCIVCNGTGWVDEPEDGEWEDEPDWLANEWEPD